jgi:methylglutaconyl-CoA hydratase
MSMDKNIIIETDARHVATLTLNRPERQNAFDDAMIADMQQALDEIRIDADVRVLVLRASGKNFSAGADLDWMRRSGQYSRSENEQDARALAKLMQTLDEFPKPSIAVVQGATYGGGVGLVACCDMALSETSARFCLSEVRLGLLPAVISPYVMRAIGARQARRYFLSGEIFDAEQARLMGLLHEVVEPNQLDARLAQWVFDLAKAAPQALAEAKQLMRKVSAAPLSKDLIEFTVQTIATRRSSEEAREGVEAFLNKRRPFWQRDDG